MRREGGGGSFERAAMSDDQLPPDSQPPEDKVVQFTPASDAAGANDVDGGEKKSRRGRATKKKKGEAATFEPGGAAKPERFDAARIAEELGIYWEVQGGDSFWVSDANGWAKWPKEALLDLCMDSSAKVARRKRDEEFMSEAARLLVHVRKNRRVEGVISGLSGYPAGVHHLPGGERFIVARSLQPVQPVAGDWSLVKELIEGRLDLTRDEVVAVPSDNDGASDEEIEAARAALRGDLRARNPVQDQVLYFHAFHQTIMRSMLYGKPGSWTQRPLLVLAGATGTGKSRLQEMITNRLLGGASADPKTWLAGEDNFNNDMVKAPHLMMGELDQVSQKMTDRLAFKEKIKTVLANEGMRARLMRTDPVTVRPFWVLTLSMNNHPDNLRSFPPLTSDFRDKVIMLLVRQAPLPMPTRTDEDKERFNAAVTAQLPAYVHWLLNDFEIPAELLKDENGGDATRFGCRSFQHPSLAQALFEDRPEAELLQMIDEACFGKMETKLWDLKSDHKKIGEAWRGSSSELESLLSDEVNDFPCTLGKQARRLFAKNDCGRMMGRLAEDRKDRVADGRTGNKRGWLILPPR